MTLKTFCAAAVSAALLIMLPGCSGPKKTCRKSAKSYFSLLSSNDWKGMFKMLTEEHRKKIGNPNNFAAYMLEVNEYFGSKNFKLQKMDVYPGKDTCNVAIVYDYAVKIRGKEEVQNEGVEETLIFKKSPKDGLWYVEIPGASNIAGY